MKLSYTQTQKYLFCSEQWKLHYQEKIRSTFVGSPLFFGNACDEAFNNLLLSVEGNKDEGEKVFLDNFKTFRYNKQDLELKSSPLVTYSNTDFDKDILLDEDLKKLNKKYEVEDVFAFFEEAKDLKRKGLLKGEDLLLFNYMCWLSLKRKGIMLVQAYRELVLPEIHKVYGVQVPVKLPNETGDTYTGFIDAVVSFKDAPNVKVVVDNKTSSKPYKEDSVSTSEQLASYCEYLEIEDAAYIVAEKNIRKREPKVRISIIRDKIKEEVFDSVFYEIDSVLKGINNNEFEKNFDSGCFQYGQRCPYFDLCRGSDDMKGLVNLNEKSKK
jgi:hypothetical protein